ncbi:transcriptional regulator vpst [hydrocarbon metagenome]|uniref:Transcriptional regulator vpst n=1 Tax=hydrocarbon metagenome TaxID=938273 RepID=A0A0W8E1I0_9ZZZZ
MLDSKDFKIYNSLIYELYHSSNLDKVRSMVLDNLIHLVPYDNAAFFLADPCTEAFLEPLLYGLDKQRFKQYQEYYEEKDEYKTAVFSHGPIPAVDRCSDYMDYRLWQKNEHRSDFLLPQGIYHIACIQILKDEQLVGEISLHRKSCAPDFSDREMYILKMLHSHINSIFINLTAVDLDGKSKSEGGSAGLINLDPLALLPDPSRENNASSPIKTTHKSLTKRERDIIILIAQGKTNQEIARQLYISENTVKTYIKRMFAKLGVKSRSELVFAIYLS